MFTAACCETVFRDAAGGERVPVACHTGVRGQSFTTGQTKKGTIPATITVVHTFAPVKGECVL